MNGKNIKQLMIAQIKSNNLPIGASLLWGDIPYGVFVDANGNLKKEPQSGYGPREGTLEDLSLVELGLILEAQEQVTPDFYLEKTKI